MADNSEEDEEEQPTQECPPDEGEEEYKRRKNRTVLTNYYGNTLSTHSGLPFGTPVAFDPPLPPLPTLSCDAPFLFPAESCDPDPF